MASSIGRKSGIRIRTAAVLGAQADFYTSKLKDLAYSVVIESKDLTEGEFKVTSEIRVDNVYTLYTAIGRFSLIKIAPISHKWFIYIEQHANVLKERKYQLNKILMLILSHLYLFVGMFLLIFTYQGVIVGPFQYFSLGGGYIFWIGGIVACIWILIRKSKN
ncbi:hypothetical protein [Lentibacillus salinarum]|uniref:DUF2812 domain-containing protein n=1 Tax=Lentibacillus salinarum TaxID=446820 RepID=A0ABW3ZZW5_9BACI